MVSGLCVGKTINGTEGTVTTPGYPSNLDFNNSCAFYIDVGSGKIELTFENVSLPEGSIISVQLLNTFKVGTHRIQSRVVYVQRHRMIMVVRLPTNITGTYGGVRLLFKRIPEGRDCKFTHSQADKRAVTPFNFSGNCQ